MNSQSLQGARQSDLRFALGMVVLAAAGLAIDAVPAKFKTLNPVAYAVDGVFKTAYPATTALVFSAGHATVPANYSCFFTVCVDGAGVVSTVQGDLYKPEVNNVTGATQYRSYVLATNAAGTVSPMKTSKLVDTTSELLMPSPPIPPAGAGQPALGIPDNVVVIGAIKVVAGGADFVPNTTALTTVGSYFNFAGVLPASTNL